MAADGLDFIFIIWMITFYFFVVLCEVRKSVRRRPWGGGEWKKMCVYVQRLESLRFRQCDGGFQFTFRNAIIYMYIYS